MKTFFFILLFSVLTLVVKPAGAQNQSAASPADTSLYPYWIKMMQDPSANFYATQKAFNTYWKNRKITKGCGWKPFKRWESYMQSRVSPNGELPEPDHTLKAFSEYMQRHDNSMSLSGNWVNQGPFNLPMDKGYKGLGRINTIAFHPADPNIIYIGAPAGGCWVTTAGGNSWTTTTDMLPTLGVSAIIVDPTTPSTIYLGTGDRDASDAPGVGVLKSTDNGQIWVQANSGMGNVIVSKMIIDPTNPSVIYAASSSGIFKSSDGAASWELKAGGNFKDITFKPNSTSVLYAATGGYFIRSTDSGETWDNSSTGIPSGDRGVIGVTPANPELVYFLLSNPDASFRGLYRSLDGGNTFTERSNSPNIMDWSCDGSGTGGQAWYDLAIAVDPLNPNIIYTGGVDIWKSTDGGVNWQINAHWYGDCGKPAVHADQHFFAFNPINNRLYIGNDGGIYWTDNGGSAWHEISDGLAISQAYKLGQSATIDDLVVNGYQDNGTSILDNDEWYAIGGGDGMECAIDYTDPMYRYTTVYYGSINRVYNTTNQGTIAGNGINGINEDGAWVTPFILDANDPNKMFIGYKNVWRSENIKASSPNSVKWKKISNINTAALDVLEQSPVNTNILYASVGNNLYISINCEAEAPAWQNISSHLPSNNVITDLEADPFIENTLYMTQGSKVYKSLDKGMTWADISGTLPDIHISTIIYYKRSHEGLYIGTDAGVYYRESGMNDWVLFSSGLPANARITELEIFYNSGSSTGDRIKASTFGRGMWKSELYANTPAADFTASQLLIPVGCAINFKDLSSGIPTQWNWSFQGGTPSASNQQDPTSIVYNSPGAFNVQLTASNSVGSGSLVKTSYIVVSDTLKPLAGFTASPRAFCNLNDVISLQDTSKYCPASWLWECQPGSFQFVNGTSSTSQNPQIQFLETGSYEIKLTVQNMNGASSIVKQDYIIAGGYFLPFSEDFESASFDYRSWSIENPDNLITWDISAVSGNTPGNHAAWMNFYNYIVPPPARRDRLVSPPLNFAGVNPVFLTFEHAYATKYSSSSDSLIVLVSEDCGISWERVFAAGEKGQGTFATVPKLTTPFVPAVEDDWCGGGWGSDCYLIDLTRYADKSGIRIAFEGYNQHSNNLYIDNINISRTTDLPYSLHSSDKIQVYPNPSSGEVWLESNMPVEQLNITVYSSQGIPVLSNSFPSASSLDAKIDLTGLAKGIYMLHICGTRTIQSNKIIIK